MNPEYVQFTADEVDRIQRIMMARWLGIPPREWDAMTYGDQCDAIEIARAEKAIERRAHDMARANVVRRRR